MFRNYLLVSLRSIWRNKVFSLINTLGLVVGITAALVVYLLVHYENSFDKFHQDGDRIYRVVSDIHFSGDSVKNSGVAVPVAAAMRENIPAVTNAALFFVNDVTGRITINGKDFKNKSDIVYADKNYFDLIHYQWLYGNPQTSLREPFTVVLTESRVQTYFPGLTPMQAVGKDIIYDDTIHATVTGVVADLKGNTDFNFKEFIALSTAYTGGLKDIFASDAWNNTNAATQLFIKLKSAADADQVTKQLAVLSYQHKEGDEPPILKLQPLADIHFNRDYGGFNRIASRSQLFSFGMVAVALLVLAGINFINLTTAQAARRARETGIRKSMGSTTLQLMTQFLSETFMLTMAAGLLSLLIAPGILLAFKSFLPEELSSAALYTAPVLLFLCALCAGVSLLAGIYPALVLSQFQPVAVLKTQVNAVGGKVWLRKTLTISQFVVAQVFIIATIIVSKQIHYSINKDLGFRKDAILLANTPFYDVQGTRRQALQEKIAAIPEVAMVSRGSREPIINGTITSTFNYNDGKKDIARNMEMRYGDSNYIQVYRLQLLAGRNLRSSDTITEWVLNEKAVAAFGFKHPQDILGVTINEHPVVGVVKDFNSGSMRSAIPPLAISSWGNRQGRNMHILLREPGEGGIVWKHAIAKIEKAWKEVYPREEFSYKFLDKNIEGLYKSEQRTATLLNWCAGLAFFISALGLLGLVIFTTNQRTREIGIRKVLGATAWQMITLLTSDFMKLVGIAFVLAIPLSWWAMQHWLASYAYRTPVSWWVFGIGGGVMALLALATMSVKIIRAAWSNPVNALKSE
jgi:putative ABC transport system permease protein